MADLSKTLTIYGREIILQTYSTEFNFNKRIVQELCFNMIPQLDDSIIYI